MVVMDREPENTLEELLEARAFLGQTLNEIEAKMDDLDDTRQRLTEEYERLSQAIDEKESA